MRLVFDIEGDNLLPKITRIHCIVAKDLDSGKVRRFRAQSKGRESLAAACEYLASADMIIGHNILDFDLRAIEKVLGFSLPERVVARDTLVLSRLIWTNLVEIDTLRKWLPPVVRKKPHSLEAWGYRLKQYKGDFAKHPTDEDSEAAWANWSKEMEDYCEQDVVVTEALWRRIEAKQYSEVAVQLEHDFKRILCMQEAHGFRFDVAACQALVGTLSAARAELTEKLLTVFPPRYETLKTPAYYIARGVKYATVGEARKAEAHRDKIKPGPLKTKEHLFNPGSRVQIAERLIERYKWHPTRFTDSGQPEISETTLSELHYPEAKLLLIYLQTSKTLGMAAEGDHSWLKLVTPEGRIHGRVNTGGAVTGRCTHSNPNVAQTPRVLCKKDAKGKKFVVRGLEGGFGWECRSLYLADAGQVLVGWDASALELRCLAHYLARYDGGAFEKVLLEGDVHESNRIAAGLYLRDSAKTFIYAYLYGAGDAKLGSVAIQDAVTAGKPVPKGSPKAIGAALRARFLKNFPALAKLKTAIERAVEERGVLNGLDGRRLHIRSDHAALNTLLQSAGAVLMKKALVFMYEALTKKGLTFGKDYAFVANVHDEVQTTCRKPVAEFIGKAGPASLQKSGEFFGFRCKLDGEYKVGHTWAETH